MAISAKKTLLLVLAFFAALCACSPASEQHRVQDDMSDDEQIELFEKVAGPSSVCDYATAIAAADSILASDRLPDSLRCFIMMERAVVLYNGGSVDAASAYADSVLGFGRDHSIGSGIMTALQIKGGALRRSGNMTEAANIFSQGMDLAVAEGDVEMEQMFADLIAIIYVEIGRAKEGLNFGKRSLMLAEELADTTAMLSAVSTIGAALSQQHDTVGVIRTLAPYGPLVPKVSPLFRMKYYTPLLAAYLDSDSLDRVREIMEEVDDIVDMFSESHYSRNVLLTARAFLAGKEGRYSDQWKFYCMVDTLGLFGKSPAVAFGERALCLEKLGRNNEAYRMEVRAYQALDSIRKSEIDRQLSEFSVKYDTLQKQYEIEHLGRQRWIWFSVALASLLILAVMAFFIVLSRRRIARRLERERYAQYVRGHEHERMRVARELHDDIAGSLVGLQWEMESMSHDDIARRLADIGSSVRRISHEMMPPQFSRQSFCRSLTDLVAQTNRRQGSPRVKLSDEGSFDWDSLSPETSVELYRIIQESLMNALKHGLPSAPVRITLGGDDRFSLVIENTVSPGTKVGYGGIGLRTMKARAAIIGTTIHTSINEDKFKQTIIQNP